MDERDLEPEEAAARRLVDELRARGRELDRARSCTSSVSSATWCIPGPRRARKRPTGVSSPVGVTSSMRLSPTRTRRGLDALLAERLAMLEPRAEERLVRRDRLVEIGDRDAEVMDPRPHAGDAIARRGSVAHRQRANRADRLRRARLGLDVREQRLELGSGRASPSRAAPARRGRAPRGASAAGASPPRTRGR